MDKVIESEIEPESKRHSEIECLLQWAKERLREEPGRGTVADAGKVGIAVIENDPAIVEAEERGAVKGAILIAMYAHVHP